MISLLKSIQRKNRLMLKGLIPYLAVLCLLVSCSHPHAVEDFRPAAERDSLGRFCYSLDMTDSAAVYDISFYARLDCPKKQFKALSDVEVDIELLSPAGVAYGETVYIPISEFKSVRNGTYDCNVVYRSGLVPAEKGMWVMNVSVEDIPGLRGLGIIKSMR